MGLFAASKTIKNALCLGGGGARGFAHIGALKAFEEEGVAFDLVAGTSVGSLIAGLYAAGVPADRMESFGDELDIKDVRSGFRPNDPLKIGALIRKLVGDVRIEDLKIPLYIVAVDLATARQVILDKGLLYEAVSASCAVPVFFRPLVKGRLHLVDGGLMNNIPADVCRMMGAQNVITVDINPTRGGGAEGIGIMDMIKGTLSIVTAAASQQGLINSDIIIAPDMSAFKATKKDGHTDMIKLGYEAAKEKMDSVKELMGIKAKAVSGTAVKLTWAEKRKLKKEKKNRRKLEKAAKAWKAGKLPEAADEPESFSENKNV